MPVVQKLLFPPLDFEEEPLDDSQASNEGLLPKSGGNLTESMQAEDKRDSSHHEEMLHPNQEDADEEEEENEKEKGCSHYFKVLDNQVLKPLLIYKFNYQ